MKFLIVILALALGSNLYANTDLIKVIEKHQDKINSRMLEVDSAIEFLDREMSDLGIKFDPQGLRENAEMAGPFKGFVKGLMIDLDNSIVNKNPLMANMLNVAINMVAPEIGGGFTKRFDLVSTPIEFEFSKNEINGPNPFAGLGNPNVRNSINGGNIGITGFPNLDPKVDSPLFGSRKNKMGFDERFASGSCRNQCIGGAIGGFIGGVIGGSAGGPPGMVLGGIGGAIGGCLGGCLPHIIGGNEPGAPRTPPTPPQPKEPNTPPKQPETPKAPEKNDPPKPPKKKEETPKSPKKKDEGAPEPKTGGTNPKCEEGEEGCNNAGTQGLSIRSDDDLGFGGLFGNNNSNPGFSGGSLTFPTVNFNNPGLIYTAPTGGLL